MSAYDPMTFDVAAVPLGGIALLASCIPTRRATKVDPMVAVRVISCASQTKDHFIFFLWPG